MRTPPILLFAEHEPTHEQFLQVVRHLEGRLGQPVAALLQTHSARLPLLGDQVAGSHGLSARSMTGAMHAEHDVEVRADQHRLHHVVGVLRSAGHEAHGELVAGPMPHAVLRAVRSRRPEMVLLVTSRHRIAHWLHHDIERRVRAHSDAEVVLGVVDGRVPATT